uniref:Uncharacterized protein n=1 Tax=Lygus hesperus TaxID=30085 RepID=A0A146LDJ0_LYGHE
MPDELHYFKRANFSQCDSSFAEHDEFGMPEASLLRSHGGIRDVQQEELLKLMHSNMESVKANDDQLDVLMEPTSAMKHACKVRRNQPRHRLDGSYGTTATGGRAYSRCSSRVSQSQRRDASRQDVTRVTSRSGLLTEDESDYCPSSHETSVLDNTTHSSILYAGQDDDFEYMLIDQKDANLTLIKSTFEA